MKLTILAAVLLTAASAANAAGFSGPSVEVRAGWDNAKPTLDGESDGGKSGLVYGAAVGYDFEIGTTAVVGALVGINGSTVKECIGGDCLKAGRDIEVLARIGFKAAPSTLVYALGGYANGRATVTSSGLSGSLDFDGFRIGAGVEQSIGTNAFAKLEYRYTSYSSQDLAGFDVGLKRSQAIFALGYRF